jgi:uncharacterized protein YbjT (DUF2867 family)
MKVLVLGGTGTTGSAVVRELLARKADVRVLTRNAESAKKLPAGVTGVVGDLLDMNTIYSGFNGIDAVFLLNALGPSESTEGLLALNGARLAGVKKIVYLSVHHLDKALHLPHFGGKLPIELALKSSGIPYTILRPNNFYQNDYWFKDVMLQYGIYPQPLGSAGVSRVDVRDIAEIAAAALTSDAALNETVNLVGPEALTGASCAAAWSKALGRPITYGGDDLDAWEKANLPYMPAVLVFDFKLMFEVFQKQGFKASAQDIERQTTLLGHPPRALADFAAETAKGWK